MLNLTAATGNQIQVMDLGFALQAHSLRELARDPDRFQPGPAAGAARVDDVVARAMLAAPRLIGLDPPDVAALPARDPRLAGDLGDDERAERRP